MRRSKNRGKLKKESLINSILKSESSNAESNCMKHFNTYVHNNNVDNSANDDDGKIRDLRAMLSRLGDIVTKDDRVKIKKDLYEIEKENLSDKEKEKIDDNLLELVNKLNKKEKYRYHDRDDLDYHGIRDIEHFFDADNNEDYCKPILVKRSLKENYKYYESGGDKDKKPLIEQYLDMIKPHLSDLINDHNAIETSSNESKIQINVHINFISSNDTGQIRTVFVWSDNEEIRLGNEKGDIAKRLVNPFLNNYQKEKLILRNGTNFVFESIGLLSYHIHKTGLKRGNSYIKSPKWVAIKKAIINPKNVDKRCFEYSIVVALHHKEIKNHPERIQDIHHYFSCGYSWWGLDFPAEIKEWKRFEKNNETIALNILQVPQDEIKITHAYKSEYNLYTQKSGCFVNDYTDGEKWYYTALKSEPTEDGFNQPKKSLSKLFRGITSNNHGDFYCLNCLHSFRTDNALKKHERLRGNNDHYSVEMPTKLNKFLKYNHGEKSLKTPFVIYVDLECLLLKQQ